MSDLDKYPPYHVEDYVDCLRVIREKFDKLCEFSCDEHELAVVGSDLSGMSGINNERAEIEVKLKRWYDQVHSLIEEFYILLFAVRDGIDTCEIFMAEINAKKKLRGRTPMRRRST
jgi:hypothetical protein